MVVQMLRWNFSMEGTSLRFDMNVVMKTFTQMCFDVDIQPEDEFARVKTVIQERTMIPVDEQCLMMGKKKINETSQLHRILKKVRCTIHSRGSKPRHSASSKMV
jgi:hypothetical protein